MFTQQASYMELFNKVLMADMEIYGTFDNNRGVFTLLSRPMHNWWWSAYLYAFLDAGRGSNLKKMIHMWGLARFQSVQSPSKLAHV